MNESLHLYAFLVLFLRLFSFLFFAFVLFYPVLFYYSLLDACFLTRVRKGVDLDGRGGAEDLKGVGERTLKSGYNV